MSKKKIAVFGGGIGGLVTAYQLSKTPEQRETFDITVYQMGWRLGGKCATGRNADKGQRIEEHGIHGFLGSYFNALTLMRELYDEWRPPAGSPIETFEDAFPIQNSAFFWEWEGDKLLRWPNIRPPAQLTLDDAPKFGSLASWLMPAAMGLKHYAGLVPAPPPALDDGSEDDPQDDYGAEFDELILLLEERFTKVEEGARTAQHPPQPSPGFDWANLNPILERTPVDVTNLGTKARRLALTLQFLKILLRGIRDDDLLRDGLKKVDDENFSDWLRRHGATEQLMRAPITLATINTTYQYPGGDLARLPVMSAASYIQWTLRALINLGGAYYLFAAGSGDTIVTPLYEVLKARGVKFEFFTRLEKLELADDGASIAAAEFSRQARAASGDYAPLKTVKGLKAWPAAPDLKQLEGAGRFDEFDFENPFTEAPGQTQERLEHGIGFDRLVAAMPPRALALCLDTDGAKLPDWVASLDDMGVTATQSLQIWLKHPVKAIDAPSMGPTFHLAGNAATGLQGHVDFGKFLGFESWPDPAPEGLMFFSGVLEDEPVYGEAGGQEVATRVVKNTARQTLISFGARLLPGAGLNTKKGAGSPFSLDFDVLYCLDDALEGQARLDQQYCRANVRPSELYTQSPPGTRALRVSPLRTGLSNMTCAGDWVDTVLNVGSFEGATMGGMLAACAIDPRLSPLDIIGIQPTPADFPLETEYALKT